MINQQLMLRSILWLAALILLCIVLFGSPGPMLAASRISPRLEEQVLQIIREHPEVILESVKTYQQQQQQQQQQEIQQAQQAFFQQLQTDPKDVIGSSPTIGAESSKIVLIEFSDFQCPYCAEAHNTLKQFIAKHPEVRLVYKHFPIEQIHPEALPAAKAAWAAFVQGKFWEYQDALFTQQDHLGEALYVSIAQNLNLDLEQFNRDRNGNAASVAIEQDIQQAQRLKLSGTPFFAMYAGDASQGYGETFSGAVGLSDIESILARATKSGGVATIFND